MTLCSTSQAKPSQATKWYSGYYALASICLILASCQGQNTQTPTQVPGHIPSVSDSAQSLLPKPNQGFKTQAVDTLSMPFDASRCGSGCQVTGTASFTLVDKSTGEISYKTAGPNATLTISSSGQVRAQVTTPGGDLYAGPKAVGNSSLSFTQLGPETVSGSLDTSAATCSFGSGSYYYWDSSSINTPVYYFQTGTLNLSYQDNKVIYRASGITSKDMGQWIAPWDASCRSGSSYENKLITAGSIDITVTLPPRIIPTLNLDIDKEIISPIQTGDEFDTATFKVHSTTNKPWELKVSGPKRGPEDENGLPTADGVCNWTKTGTATEQNKDLIFDGKCDGGGDMLDGDYEVKLTSDTLSDTGRIKIDNTPPKVQRMSMDANEDQLKFIFDIEDPTDFGSASGIDIGKSKLLVNGQEILEGVSKSDNQIIYTIPSSQQNTLEEEIAAGQISILTVDKVENRKTTTTESTNASSLGIEEEQEQNVADFQAQALTGNNRVAKSLMYAGLETCDTKVYLAVQIENVDLTTEVFFKTGVLQNGIVKYDVLVTAPSGAVPMNPYSNAKTKQSGVIYFVPWDGKGTASMPGVSHFLPSGEYSHAGLNALSTIQGNNIKYVMGSYAKITPKGPVIGFINHIKAGNFKLVNVSKQMKILNNMAIDLSGMPNQNFPFPEQLKGDNKLIRESYYVNYFNQHYGADAEFLSHTFYRHSNTQEIGKGINKFRESQFNSDYNLVSSAKKSYEYRCLTHKTSISKTDESVNMHRLIGYGKTNRNAFGYQNDGIFGHTSKIAYHFANGLTDEELTTVYPAISFIGSPNSPWDW